MAEKEINEEVEHLQSKYALNLSEELKPYIITEQDMRDEFSKGAIEMSFTGEWVPLEVVEGKFKEFIKELKDFLEREGVEVDKDNHPSIKYIDPLKMYAKINKLAGDKLTK